VSAAEIRSWARDVRSFASDAPGDVIEVVDDAITARLRADTGGDGALSRGRSLGRASTRVTKRKGEALGDPAGSHGVWGILQGGTKAHTIVADRGRALLTPKGPRPKVRIPATRARHTFTEGADRGIVDAQRKLEADWARL
jgi:hypothetical protein